MIRSAASVASANLLDRQDHGEFIAAQPRDERIGRQCVTDALGGGCKQPVADTVAERVIDCLEMVEIDDQHRAATLRPLCEQRAVELVTEMWAIGQAGQLVMARHIGDLRLGPAPFGYVEHRNQRDQPVLAHELTGKDHALDRRAIGSPLFPDAVRRDAACRERDPRLVPFRRQKQGLGAHAAQLGRRIAVIIRSRLVGWRQSA